MVGPSADTGLECRADPQPLTDYGEALALLAGRDTFELRWIGDHYEIAGRDYFRIRGSPAGSMGIDVLVAHDCELADQWPTMQSRLDDYRAPVEYGESPPY
jgi:hypothetical protein